MAGSSLSLGLMLFAVAVAGLGFVSGEMMSSCFTGANKSLDIDCGAGYMIHITRSFYGYSPSGQCRLVHGEQGGCLTEEHVNYACVGQSSCSINLPTGQFGVNIKSCDKTSNYFQVDYKCVPANNVHDICSETELYEQSGYIRTPRYPGNYHQQGTCGITIHAHSSQKIRLQIIDMELKDSGHTECLDHIYFNDKLRSMTLCGERSNKNYTMRSNYLHVELESKSRAQSKGFWLYYEAFPPLPNTISTPPNDKTPEEVEDNRGQGLDNHEQEEQEDIEGDKGDNTRMSTTPATRHPKNTVPLYRNSRGSGKSLPFAAIAGGVIGTLSLILIILLVLLLIKWLKERRYQKAEKILEIRNPAFRSSGDFYEQQQNNYC